MKQALLLFPLLFILTPVAFSQEKVLDAAYLKCQYKHSYLKDTLDVATFDDLFILQIGKNISKFYSYYTFQSDSLAGTPEGEKKWKELFDKALSDFSRHRDKFKFRNSFPSRRGTAYVYKNYPQGKNTVTDFIFPNEFVMYEDEMNNQDWQIQDSLKSILGYTCQQAICDFRGRRWTAWFALDVPTSDGPWKFGGLPGLIMEAYDRGKQYYFVIVGLEQVDDEAIVLSDPSLLKGKKFREINRRELLKAKMHQLTNSASMMEMETGVPFGNNKPVYRDLIERDYR